MPTGSHLPISGSLSDNPLTGQTRVTLKAGLLTHSSSALRSLPGPRPVVYCGASLFTVMGSYRIHTGFPILLFQGTLNGLIQLLILV